MPLQVKIAVAVPRYLLLWGIMQQPIQSAIFKDYYIMGCYKLLITVALIAYSLFMHSENIVEARKFVHYFLLSAHIRTNKCQSQQPH